MASYPAFAQLLDGSSEEREDDVEVDRAVGGGAKVRSFYSEMKRRFTVCHKLNDADGETLDTFYDDNKLLAVDFTWEDGEVYACLFDGPPKVELTKTATLRKYTVKLVER